MPRPKYSLMGLTSAGAFLLFCGAAAVSLAGVLFDLGRPWLVLSPILVYGAILWFCQRRYYVALNSTTKDSPYFLGFTLTLVALARLFLVVGAPGRTPIPSEMLPSIAEALLTTVLGLSVRQALYSLDPGEATRDSAFQALVASIRQNASDFHSAQQQLVALIREFSLSREQMFAAEQSAHSKYVQSLSTAASQLTSLEQSWPTRLTEVESAVRRAAEQLAASTDQSLSAIRGLQSAVASTTADAQQVVAASAADIGKRLSEAGRRLEADAVGIASTVRSTSVALRAEREALERDAVDHASRAKELSKSLDVARTGLAAFAAQLSDASTASVPMIQAVTAMSNDLKALDGIVDQVIDLLGERILDLAPSDRSPSSEGPFTTSPRRSD